MILKVSPTPTIIGFHGSTIPSNPTVVGSHSSMILKISSSALKGMRVLGSIHRTIWGTGGVLGWGEGGPGGGRQGEAWQGRRGRAGREEARRGLAEPGGARRGEARRGEAGWGGGKGGGWVYGAKSDSVTPPTHPGTDVAACSKWDVLKIPFSSPIP